MTNLDRDSIAYKSTVNLVHLLSNYLYRSF